MGSESQQPANEKKPREAHKLFAIGGGIFSFLRFLLQLFTG